MWFVWNKQTEINGFSAEEFFNRHEFLRNESTIFIRADNGRVTQVEGKGILAAVYNIDPTLPDNEFIAEYESIISTPAEEPIVEEPEANTL